MSGSRRTIVMLSPKRSGSTAMFRLFQNHPDVQVGHHDQGVPLWETQFWSLGARAIEGDGAPYVERMREAFPFLPLDDPPSDADELFGQWDAVLDRLGPVVFDKSPQYLDSPAGLDLLREYRNRGNDVRVFGFVRHPQDTITSQYELWGPIHRGGTLQDRERHWVGIVERLEQERGRWKCLPVFRYEDFAGDPDRHAAELLETLGLDAVPAAWAHIRPVNVGKYETTWSRTLRRWSPSDDLRAAMLRYGYEEMQPVRRRRMPTRLELGARLRRIVP